jgi:hypothetical protein
VIRAFEQYGGRCVVHQFRGDPLDGSYGRIAVKKRYFDRIGGYDESFDPMIYQDDDLIERLSSIGLKYVLRPDPQYNCAIPNTKEEGIAFTGSSKTVMQMLETNLNRSHANLSEGRIIANNGTFGIRQGLFDHKGQAFCPEVCAVNCPEITIPTVSGLKYAYKKSHSEGIGEKDEISHLSDCLDMLIRHIAKASAVVSETGLLNGRTGIAILLYHYAQYRNDPKLTNCANHLTMSSVEETDSRAGKGFESGLCGIAWGVDYLIKQRFVKADASIFEEIDAVLFQERMKTLTLNDLDTETEKGLYLWNRLQSCEPDVSDFWQSRLSKLITCFRSIINLKSLNSPFRMFSCSSLIRFFHICETLRKQDMYGVEIEEMYEALPEIVRISFYEEKRISDRYMLSLLLADIPLFEKWFPPIKVPDSLTLKDVINFFLTCLILGRSLPIPDAVYKTLLSIAQDPKRIRELICLMSPGNMSLRSYAGGLAWAMTNILTNQTVSQ